MKVKLKLLPVIGALVLLSFLPNCTSEPTQTTLPPKPTATKSTAQSTVVEPPLPTQSVAVDTQIRAADGMLMFHVPSGTFTIGSTDEQAKQVIQDCLDTYGAGGECRQEICRSLQPAQLVSLNSFWLDQTEVTNLMYTAFLNVQCNHSENGVDWFEPGTRHSGIVYGHIREEDGIFKTKAGYEDHPVIEVS